MNKRLRWVSVTLVFLVILSVSAIAASRADFATTGSSDSNSPPSLEVETLELGTITPPQRSLRYRGAVLPRRQSRLAFRRGGKIQSIAVNEGDYVNANEVLATLDTDDLVAERDSLVATRNSADAAWREALQGPRVQTIQNAEALLAALRAQADSAVSRRDRQIQLMRRGAGSEQTLDDATFDAKRLAASVTAATANLAELRAGTRSEQVDAAKALLAVAEANLAANQVRQNDSKIVAPYDCIVSMRNMDEGSIVDPSQVVIEVVEVPPLEARFGLPAETVATLRIGQQIDIDDQSLAATGNRSAVQGKVVRIHPTIDTRTRTRRVDVLLPVDADMTIGQTVTAAIHTNRQIEDANQSTFWVPTTALVRGSRGLWSLYVVVPDADAKTSVIERRNIRILQTVGELNEVEGMVQAGENIIAIGVHRLGPGIAVTDELSNP